MDMHPDALRQRFNDGATRGEHEQPRPMWDVAGPSGHDDVERLPLVRVTCLGTFAVCRHGERIPRWDNRKARELLAYLATRTHCAATHAELVEALWPDDDFVAGQRLLYTAVWVLRKTLDDSQADEGALPVARGFRNLRGRAPSSTTAISFRASALASDRGRYALDRSVCSTDLADLREQLDHLSPDATPAEWLMLAERASLPLLAGETYPWLPAVRNQLRSRCLTTLRRVVQRALGVGDASLALTALHRRLELDPAHEESVALAMRLHMRRSEFAAAADCYRSLCVALKRSAQRIGGYPAAPSAELQALFASMQIAGAPSGSAAASPARAPPA